MNLHIQLLKQRRPHNKYYQGRLYRNPNAFTFFTVIVIVFKITLKSIMCHPAVCHWSYLRQSFIEFNFHLQTLCACVSNNIYISTTGSILLIIVAFIFMRSNDLCGSLKHNNEHFIIYLTSVFSLTLLKIYLSFWKFIRKLLFIFYSLRLMFCILV